MKWQITKRILAVSIMAIPIEKFDEVKEIFKIKELEQFQKDTLLSLIAKRDVFLSVKTESGKSICYHAFVPLWLKTCNRAPANLESRAESPELADKCTVLVISPLISIMKEQCDYLNSLGFSATYLGKDEKEETDILSHNFEFLFSSPETILSVGKWRDMLVTPNSIRPIAVDEAHTVLQW